ncbi:hypothetical protein B0H11DRAFT_2220160 [Mycena galericulata]|nr:hypothetical protein B0H11DRAFT_2220160 [Mycena galericulata]
MSRDSGDALIAHAAADAIPRSCFDFALCNIVRLSHFRDIQRLHAVGEHTVLGASGDMRNFQYIQSILYELMIEEYHSDLMYARRSKMDPLGNSLLVGGFEDGQRHVLGVCGPAGTYSASTLATGYGTHITQPLLRCAVEGPEEEEARTIIEQSMRCSSTVMHEVSTR